MKRCSLWGANSSGDEVSAKPLLLIENGQVALAKFNSSLPNYWSLDEIDMGDHEIPFLWCLGKFIQGTANFVDIGSIHGSPRAYPL